MEIMKKTVTVNITSFKVEYDRNKSGVYLSIFSNSKEVAKLRMDYDMGTALIRKAIQFENRNIEFTFPRGSLKQIKMYVDNESIKNKRLSIDD